MKATLMSNNDCNYYSLDFEELTLVNFIGIRIYTPDDSLHFIFDDLLDFVCHHIEKRTTINLSPKLQEIYPRIKAELENITLSGEDTIISDETADFIKLIYRVSMMRISEVQGIFSREIDFVSIKSAN